jgi:hypothetical protein
MITLIANFYMLQFRYSEVALNRPNQHHVATQMDPDANGAEEMERDDHGSGNGSSNGSAGSDNGSGEDSGEDGSDCNSDSDGSAYSPDDEDNDDDDDDEDEDEKETNIEEEGMQLVIV